MFFRWQHRPPRSSLLRASISADTGETAGTPWFKQDIGRYVRFALGGSLSVILNLICTYLLTEFLYLWHMLSYALSLLVELAFLFVYHSFVTFRRQGKFWRFALIVNTVSALNWIAVYLFSEYLMLHYILSIVLAASSISMLHYSLLKRLAFDNTPPPALT